MHDLHAFLEKAMTDKIITEKLIAVTGGSEATDIYPKVVGLANEYGFTVSEEDVKQVHEESARATADTENSDGDLSDDELENVSGGFYGYFAFYQSIARKNGTSILP